MKQRITTLGLALICLCQSAYSQESKFAWKLSGYVQNQIISDSRASVTALDGLVVMYPKAPVYDANHEDLNAVPSLSYLSISSRLRTTVFGPNIFGAKTGAVIEADFTTSGVVAFRLRHAYMTFDWANTHLLMGQTWHPFMIPDVFPQLVTSSLGAPYQSFSRAPQMLLKQKLNQNVSLQGALVFQNEFSSFGPNGKSATYSRNAIVPNVDLQLQVVEGGLKYGLAYDMKCIMPATQTTSPTNGNTYKTDTRLYSQAIQAYIQYKENAWQTAAKVIYGQNLADQLMIGGLRHQEH